MDLFGGDRLEDMGQRQSAFVQHSVVLVAVKTTPEGTCSIVRKHYQNGIMTHDEDNLIVDGSYNNSEF